MLIELRVASAQPLLEAAAGCVDVEPASAVGAVAVDELGRSEREVAGGEQVLLVAEQDGELALQDSEAVGVVVMDVRFGGARPLGLGQDQAVAHALDADATADVLALARAEQVRPGGHRLSEFSVRSRPSSRSTLASQPSSSRAREVSR